MNVSNQLSWWAKSARWLIILTLLASLSSAQAADIKLEIQLIWGCNDAQSPNPNHKPVDDELAKRLSKVFKWKHYFLVRKLDETVTSRATKRIKVSTKSEIEITEMEGPSVEVKLFGEGKLINKSVKQLQKGEHFVLAGEDKNETAWFILITQLQ